ncbi:ArsR family transcriptional regulator [Haloferax sp. MBLA0076]|uniref:ArsR family transcriptional regulator n=1 Tax=Haloferax litoreum TaxID=2666140 RepID=A0A6A8GGE9_9EURY|nr:MULTISPECIES: helix-turn-helix domain-containing protein [Haloferax]KAB1192414.1 helix-turn-helix transcriptional regulator [Haloferax sp. CBA1148]MRX20880.1 ArsR family transcriptional regulator [Haloferax litoreum]
MGEEDTSQDSVDPNSFRGDEKIDSALKLRNAFSEAITHHGFPDTLVLSRERADDVFHERRIRIMDYLKTYQPQSVRALAKELDVDKGVISRDLQKLRELDIVEFENDGRSKAPKLKHQHVVVEPVI